MEQIILVIHLLIAVALVAVVLLQRSEGGGLGIGGGGGGMGALMSVRGTANLLTRITAILAGCFMVTSLTLAILSGAHSGPARVVEEDPAGAAVPGFVDEAPVDPLDRPLTE